MNFCKTSEMVRIMETSNVVSSAVETKSEHVFKVGDRVFAQGRGHLPWPAMVLLRFGGEPEKYHVQYYGTYDSEKVGVDKLYSYNKENLERFGHPDPFRGPQLFTTALDEIELGEYPAPLTKRKRSSRHTIKEGVKIFKIGAVESIKSQENPDKEGIKEENVEIKVDKSDQDWDMDQDPEADIDIEEVKGNSAASPSNNNNGMTLRKRVVLNINF